MPISLILKALMGAGIVIAIDMLAHTKHAFLAGMLPLFPAFMLISHFLVAKNRPAEFGNTVVFGMCSLVPYLIYLGIVFALHKKMTIVPTLLIGTAGWIIAAGLLVFVWNMRHTA